MEDRPSDTRASARSRIGRASLLAQVFLALVVIGLFVALGALYLTADDCHDVRDDDRFCTSSLAGGDQP